LNPLNVKLDVINGIRQILVTFDWDIVDFDFLQFRCHDGRLKNHAGAVGIERFLWVSAMVGGVVDRTSRTTKAIRSCV